jgi:hypothetical protein
VDDPRRIDEGLSGGFQQLQNIVGTPIVVHDVKLLRVETGAILVTVFYSG